MKILVFTEGTLIMHRSAAGLQREQIVKQVIEGKDPSLHDWKSYVPVGNGSHRLGLWKNQGAEIFYLTSRTEPADVKAISQILKKYGFPAGQLLYRRDGQQYKDIAEKIAPDIIIEDDCESIGGENQMTYTRIRPELKKRITLVKVKEFGGIDHLPENIHILMRVQRQRS
jgi:hypothetical protein